MTRYFLGRIAFLPPLLLLISFLAFVLVRVAPGGPFDKERTPSSPDVERRLKAKYHLDEPVWKQYLRYTFALCHGDFGPSLKQRNHTVNDIIAAALPISLELGFLAFFFALAVGVPLGFVGALQKTGAVRFLGSFFSILFICIPPLVLGPVLTVLFAIKLRWFPVALWGSPWHAVLPTVTLGIYFAGRIAQLMREGLVPILHAEFLTTARAKGLTERSVLLKHALPLAILPVVSYSGPLLADLLTGSFVVENIFQIPGIGVFMVNSSLTRDYPLIVGLVILYAFLLLVLNLFVDLIYTFLDPRVRFD